MPCSSQVYYGLLLAWIALLGARTAEGQTWFPNEYEATEDFGTLHNAPLEVGEGVEVPGVQDARVDVYCSTERGSHHRRLFLLPDGDSKDVELLARQLAVLDTVIVVHATTGTTQEQATRLGAIADATGRGTLGPCRVDDFFENDRSDRVSEVSGIIALGHGASVLIRLLEARRCEFLPERKPTMIFVAPVLDRERFDALTSCHTIGGETLVIEPEEGRCGGRAQRLIEGPLDSIDTRTLTLRGTGFCDATAPESGSCAARCGASTEQGSRRFRRYLVGRLTGRLSDTTLWDRRWIYDPRRAGELSFEYRQASDLHAAVLIDPWVLIGGGLTVGRSGSGTVVLAAGPSFAFRPAVMFGRRSPRSFGFELYSELGTHGVLGAADFYLGGGIGLLCPTPGWLEGAIVPSVGGAYRFLQNDGGGLTFGMYVGRHPYHRRLKDPGIGLRIDAFVGFEPTQTTALVLSVQIHPLWFALPFAALAFR